MILLDNHPGDRQKDKAKTKRYPGCLAHAAIGMFYSVVTDQCQPQYTYNVLQRRCQPRLTIKYIYIYIYLFFGGAYSFVACLSHLTIDPASLSRPSTVPTPNRDTSTGISPKYTKRNIIPRIPPKTPYHGSPGRFAWRTL